MGKDQPTKKDRLIELLIVAFAVVTMSLLIVQMAMNVADTLDTDAEEDNAAYVPTITATPRPVPTYYNHSDMAGDA
jgi:flagellar basal body-associated protein FliL